MDYSIFKNLTGAQDWFALWPEISLACIALLMLLMDALLPRRLNGLARSAGMLANTLLFVALLMNLVPAGRLPLGSFFGGMIEVTPLGHWFRVFFMLGNLSLFWLAGNYLRERRLVRTEYFVIANLVTAAMGLLAQSQHFAVLFVALETIAIGFYVLVSYDRNSAFSLEAGIKYLVIGGTNTAILLLGIALLYGIGGNAGLAGASADPLLFSNLGAFLSENSGHPIAQMGVLMVLASVAFKVGLVPFQIWIPDVYQGAPTPTTSLLSVSSKAAGFLVLFLLFDANGAFHAMVDFVFPILVVVTIVSMIYGNITALGYTNVKRLLGMSGVSHASFLMIGVLVWMQTGTVEWVSGSILFYLFAYMLASLTVFGVMSIVSVKEDSAQDLYDYTGLSEQRPMLAGMLAIGLGSLAGIPPLVGFLAKFSLFVAAFKSGLFWLLAAAVISVVISIFYYFKWMREAYFHDPVSDLQLDDTPREPVVFAKANKVDALILITLAVAIVVLGLYPMNLISTWSVF